MERHDLAFFDIIYVFLSMYCKINDFMISYILYISEISYFNNILCAQRRAKTHGLTVCFFVDAGNEPGI